MNEILSEFERKERISNKAYKVSSILFITTQFISIVLY
jgi:hypothetical protein